MIYFPISGHYEMKCAFCQKIGSHLSLSLEHGGIVPKEFDNFTILLVTRYKNQQVNFPDTYLCCPQCHTIYRKTRYIDNDIMYPSDDIEFEEINKEEFDILSQDQKNRIQNFADEIDKRMGDKLKDLTPIEKEILNLFINELKEQLSIYSIAAEFENEKNPAKDSNIIYPMDKKRWNVFEKEIQTAINSLIEKEIIKKDITCGIETYRIFEE